MKKFRFGNRKEESDAQKLVMKVSVITIAVNTVLSAGKLLAGMMAHSGAMISDGIHSASDVFSTVIVMVGTKVSARQSDKEHPYGHERMECVAAILLSAVLFLTGLAIGFDGIQKIAMPEKAGLAVPGFPALAAAVLSIGIKEWMYWYTRAAAKKAHSCALMADAWHHRSDAASSVGALVGIVGARLGYPVLDPAAGVVICLFIGKAAARIFKEAAEQMVDRSCGDETVAQMRQAVLSVHGVCRIDEMKTRRFGSRIYVDLEIAAPGSLPLVESHRIAESVHLTVEREFPDVKHCMVHVNPTEETAAEKSGKIPEISNPSPDH